MQTHAQAGAKGGRAKVKTKGFGSNPELARIAGAKGKATRYGKSLDDFKLNYEGESLRTIKKRFK